MKKISTLNLMSAAALGMAVATGTRSYGPDDLKEGITGRGQPDLIILDEYGDGYTAVDLKTVDMSMIEEGLMPDMLGNISNEEMERVIKVYGHSDTGRTRAGLYDLPFEAMNMANFVHAFDQAERSTLPEFWGTKKNYKPSPDRQKVLDKRAKNKANRKRGRHGR